ncbi:MAG: hypothetical protein AB8I08_24160 [Sandaracinaceae bacterium]
MLRPRRAGAVLMMLAGLVAGCGGAVPPSETPEAAPQAALPPLDLPRLLPVQTQGVARADVGRLLRSPHYPAIAPHLMQIVAEVEDEGAREQIEQLIGQTETVVIGLLPDGVVILAEGRYEANVVGRLAAASPTSAIATVRGHEVLESVDPSDDEAPSLAQVRPDTLVLAAPAEAMELLLARVNSPPTTGERWPSRVRENVAQTDIVNAMVGFALGQSAMGDEPFTFSGRANLDGALSAEVRLHTTPQFVQIASMTVEGLLRGVANEASEDHPVLARLPELTRTRVEGDSVVVSVESDAATAETLVPALIDLLVEAVGGPSEEQAQEQVEEQVEEPAPAPE